MGAGCSLPTSNQTAVQKVDIRNEEVGRAKPENGGVTTLNKNTRPDKHSKKNSDPQNDPYSCVLETENQRNNMLNPGSDITVTDVVEEDAIDPSLNIQQTAKKIQKTRRTSRMENEAVTRQKLLRRVKSYEESDQAPPASPVQESPTPEAETLDASLNINALEQKLTKTRRVSHSTYQQRLSMKKESLKKKTSVTSDDGTQAANAS